MPAWSAGGGLHPVRPTGSVASLSPLARPLAGLSRSGARGGDGAVRPRSCAGTVGR